MIKLKIDNRTFEVEEGRTILDIAREGNIEIPTLCHFDNIPADASCMVCAVRDKKSHAFIPACATTATEGMEIDASSVEVIEFRKNMMQMLIMEHRAECEAPCRLACPADYNIPLLNYHLSKGNMKNALSILLSEMTDGAVACENCEAPCENVCNRRNIDSAISIRKLHLFIASKLDESVVEKDEIVKVKPIDRDLFQSKLGTPTAEEFQEWLNGMEEHSDKRCETIDGFISARIESKFCMQCECSAVDDCKFRILATEMGLKDSGKKVVGVPIKKRVNQSSNLIFENAKCIKCGLCTRICNDGDLRAALCFVNRGINVELSEAIGVEFAHIPFDKANLYKDICPTGALHSVTK